MAVPHFDPADLTRAVSDTLSVRRVFGEAYERDGTLVIPVARVWGATGSGSGSGQVGVPADAEGEGVPAGGQQGDGGGGGYGVHVTALGVFVVDGSGARWQPALDVNRVVLGAQLVGAVVLSTAALAWAFRRR
ncbi:spore germination protein GerW family protein [uncultured Cellulomonas sp.]|uniref:spore germination protein GerW family protein n=1 Tax=uncultured Cellulomonas sp. TaxID=189682 RepID=UPI0028E73DF9|nr:spore germination protein GerW family protein [uncultured Cellulomonas sp.]